MSKNSDNIRKIAKTAETNAKIRTPVFIDKPSIPSQKGYGFPAPIDPKKFCDIIYTTRSNSYDVGDLLAGLAGPLLNNHCDHIDTLTGLTDFDTAQNSDNYGAVVNLVIHFNGTFI